MRDSLEAFKNQSFFSLESIVFGSDDYVASIGAKRSINGEELTYARQSIGRGFQKIVISLYHIFGSL